MNFKNVRIKNSDKLDMLFGLRTMLMAGVSILEIVELLETDAKGGLKIFLHALDQDLSQGGTISGTMAKFTGAFDKVTVNVFKAGEESGTLEQAIKDVWENIKQETKFNDKIRSALLYPLIIAVVFILVVLTILIFVIPRIAKVFLSLKMTLPLPTRILIFLSDMLLHQYIYVILGLSFLFVAGALIYLKKRNALLGIFFSLPLISGLVREIDFTRFSRSLALLLESGLPIVTCLDLTKDVVFKKEVNKVIVDSMEVIAAGKRLSEGLSKSKKIVPKIMIKLIEAGEKSGSLKNSMEYISEHLEYQVEKKLATVTTLVEPIFLVVIGLVIGSIMLSIIGPIYSLIGQIGPK